MSRTIFQKITSSLWILISFIPFFNGLGFVYLGNKRANSSWFLEGLLYELPWIVGIITISNISLASLFITLAVLAQIVSIIRSIMLGFNYQKILDKSSEIDKSFGDKLGDLINSLWVLISFIPFLNGIGLIFKGKSSSKKSWIIEGMIYEIPWIVGFLTWNIQLIRFIAFEIAVVFYFVSIVRSIMVASEVKPLYGNENDSFSKEPKDKDTREAKIEEEKTVDVEDNDGAIPAFHFYEKKFKDLEDIYPSKEKNTMELIERRFAPPQLTYTRFKKVVDDSHETFYSQLNSAYNILDLSTEYSSKVEEELKNKIVVLNSIIKGLDKLSEELVLNISQVESESYDELEELFDEFSRVTSSVKNYE
ncbi:hypothetical protein [Methanobrevibacter olleyae]|uniref:Uncharacterized protein n=1 Tax=Methanobrevibacter olleyae TaxID=294671 RepID=A0A126QZ60_METOL|nr:hypothetical protein [Methanobrevibacter olleyae]AMK15341.1 hypothetical protein YLM1_0784 [Methanobrevibacter olleyae]